MSVTILSYWFACSGWFFDSENGRFFNVKLFLLAPQVVGFLMLKWLVFQLTNTDEPEIHLHPYMQRSLIKVLLCELLGNQDTDFLFLLKKYFDIDALDGQIITASHAPTIFFDRHEHIIQFCKDEGVVAVSGSDLVLDHFLTKKHLLLNFPYITEAFFSRCVILVEGETEFGAIPVWGDKKIKDLDDYGITVIRVGGIKSLPHVATLLDHFRIPHVSIIDKDDDNNSKEKYTSIDGLRTTTHRDFEEDLIEKISSTDPTLEVMFDFLEFYGESGLDRYAKIDRLPKLPQHTNLIKLGIQIYHQYKFADIKGTDDKNLLKAMFLSWMTGP